MKQGSFRAICLANIRAKLPVVFLLAIISLTAFSVFGDEGTVNYMSIILENFNGSTSHEWTYGSKPYSYEFEWALDASKFATKLNDESFPKLAYVGSGPMQVHGASRKSNGSEEVKSLGIHGKFDRRGYNWIDVFPVKVGSGGESGDPEPFEIPIPGRLQYLDLWVWGSNLNYYIEAYFRDLNGVVHTLPMGSIAYQGWKNLRVRVPNTVPQSKRVLPLLASLNFIKFRIWTTPLEKVDNFFIYFNQMKVLTDVFESIFDGDELADPERVNELWAQN